MPAIYTRTGDKGGTGLFGGSRVPKQSWRVEAYGCVDEANAWLGEAKVLLPADEREKLNHIQKRLFVLAAELASDAKGTQILANKISDADVVYLENLIDECLEITGPQKNFVIPGRDEPSAKLHVARTVVRRAERQVLRLAEQENVRPEVIKYLNRCSDAIYSLARLSEHRWDVERLTKMVRGAVERVLGVSLEESAKVKPAEKKPEVPQHFVMNLELANKLAEAAKQKAEAMQVPIVFAAVDQHGNLVCMQVMERTLLASHDIAMNKAWTALAFKQTTQNLGKAAAGPNGVMPGVEAGNKGRVVLFGGGAPIYCNGTIVGAIGISGGTVEQDVTIMNSALKEILGVTK